MRIRKISSFPFLKRLAIPVSLVLLGMTQVHAADDPTNISGVLRSGVVVEKVAANSVAEKAALQPGDVLLRWTRGDATGEIESPFDVSLIEIEQAPRGVVKLEGLRGTETREWSFPPGDWGLKTRPNLQGSLLSLYSEGQHLAEGRKATEAAHHWQAAAVAIGNSVPTWVDIWLLSHAADTLVEARLWKEADAGYEEIIAPDTGASAAVRDQLLLAWGDAFRLRADWGNAERYYRQAAGDNQKPGTETLFFADILDRIGFSVFPRGDLAGAEKIFQQALAIQQKLAPGSLSLAKSLNGLGNVAHSRGDLEKAEDYYRQAYTIRQKLAPGSLDVAASLNNLGNVARTRGDLDNAREFFRRALEIREKLSPGSLDVAAAFNNLGLVAWDRGDLAEATRCHSQALAIQQELAPDSLEVARSLNNLGIVSSDVGDLVHAEDYALRALAIREKLAPDSLVVATTLNNLGNIAEQRGDLAEAEWYSSRALAIVQKQAPGSLALAIDFNNLADIMRESGDLEKAEDYLNQSLAIKQKLGPDSLNFAFTLADLGGVSQSRGDLKKAEECYRRALEIEQRLAPGTLFVASSFNNLAGLFMERGDLVQAESYYRQAGAIEEKLAPESKAHAEVLASLAGIMLRKGQSDGAASLLDQALTALESQTAHLGGSEDVRSNFRAKYLGYYRDYVDLLIRQKQPELAFQVLERSRARTLLEMLNEAHVDVHKGVEAGLLQRKRSLAGDLSAKYNRRIELLSGKHSDEQIATVNQEIERLVAQHKDVEERIVASSPDYAALTQPRLLGVKEIEQLLDDDSLLLEYSLGAEHSYVFALTTNSLEVFPLPKGAELDAIGRRAYEELSVNNPDSGHVAITTLSRTLLDPVIGRLGKKRLVIVADGVLQYISFGALQTSQGAPLVAEHEIAYLPSGSTLVVLRRQTEGRTRAPQQVAVLADPVFDVNDVRLKSPAEEKKNIDSPKQASLRSGSDATAADPADSTSVDLLTRSTSDLGMTAKGAIYLPRLLSSRQEATNILAVAQSGQSMEALDFDASRSAAISPTLAQYRIVHFATHGLVNSTHPELSGLVLSLVNKKGEQQNGFLGLEDIYNMNLPADLVVLSACETGLGREIQGEGLVGLTRAFMYAGAPRVVASLWQVPDRATAELMKRFYTAMLVDHLTPAAALRQAQISLSKEKRWSAPYYWAGFILQGEWK
jgi:CHAT domain-containing protein/tetratricopeptide (TPR) repeat protein